MFSPDGETLYFVRDHNLWALVLETGVSAHRLSFMRSSLKN